MASVMNQSDDALFPDAPYRPREAPPPGPPTTSSGFVYRGNMHYQRKDFARAAADYTEALRLDPNNGEAHFKRGRVHFFNGEYEEALADFNALLALAVDD